MSKILILDKVFKNSTMNIGKTQSLKIVEANNSGAFLESENGERAFLPKIFLDENAEIDDDVEVFV